MAVAFRQPPRFTMQNTRQGPRPTNFQAASRALARGRQRQGLSPQMVALAAAARQRREAQAQGGGGGGGGVGVKDILGGIGEFGGKALEVLDLPRATVNALLTEGVAELIQRMPDAERYPTLDTNFSWGDIGENIKSHAGFGETLVEPIMGPEGDDWGIWPRRIVGFAGDVAADPLTYTGLGVGKAGAMAGKEQKALALGKLLDAQQEAGRGVEAANAFRALGFADEAVPAGLRAAEARAPMLGGIEDIGAMGRRGFGYANPEQLAAMDLGQNRLRFGGIGGKGGVEIPGTQRLAEGVTKATGRAKERLADTSLGSALRKISTRKGYVEQDLLPYYERILLGQGDVTMEEALRAVESNQIQRRVGEGFAVPASDELNRMGRELEGMSEDEIRALVKAAEEDDTVENILTNMAPRVRQAAKRVGGDIPELEGQRYVMPHVIKRDARDAILEAVTGENKAVRAWMRKAGITKDDLLEEGGFLQKRQFRKGGKITIGGKEVDIVHGSVDELNTKLRQLIPGFEGDFYETDPRVAWQHYIQATKRDVAKRAWGREATKRGFPGLVNKLADEDRPVYDPMGGRRGVREGDQAAMAAIENPAGQPLAPEGYVMRPDEALTTRRNQMLLESQPAAVNILERQAQGARETAAETLRPAHEELVGGVTRALDEAAAVEAGAERRAAKTSREFRDVMEQKGLAEEGIRNSEAELKRLRAEIRKIEGNATRSVKRAQQTRLNQLRAEYDAAVARHQELLAAYNEAQAAPLAKARRAALDRLPQQEQDKVIELTEQMGRTFKDSETALKNRRVEAEKSWLTQDEARLGFKPRKISRRNYNSAVEQLENHADDHAEYLTLQKNAQRQRRVLQNSTHEGARKGAQTKLNRVEERLRSGRMKRIAKWRETKIIHEDMVNYVRNTTQGELTRYSVAKRELEAWRHAVTARRQGRPWQHTKLEDIERATQAEMRKWGGEQFPEWAAKIEAARRGPRVAQAAQEVEQAKGALGWAGGAQKGPFDTPEMAAVAMEKSRPYRESVEQQLEDVAAHETNIGAQQSFVAGAEAELGNTRQMYLEFRGDVNAARQAQEEIEGRIGDLTLPPEPTQFARSKKGVAAKSAIETTIKGDLAPIEAQPMARIMHDLRALNEANPLGDDDLLNRTEAVLTTAQGQIADITTKDISLHQANKVVRDAQSGRLPAVLSAQMDQGFSELWEEGDILIRDDLRKLYTNIQVGMKQPGFGKAFTLYTNFFKTYATLTPGFHVRNAITALFMNFSDDVSSATQMKGLRMWRAYANSENPIQWLTDQPKSVQQAFEATFASGAGGRLFESGVAQTTGRYRRSKEALFSNPFTRTSQRWGQDWVEGPMRLSMAMDSVAKGQDVNQALARISRIHFDYSQVSDFDEKAKRFIPFWTYTSRNIPLQFTQIVLRPRTYAHYASFARNFAAPMPEGVPGYIEQGGGFYTGVDTPDWLPLSAGGMPIVLSPDLPHLKLEDTINRYTAPLRGESMGQALSDVNPIFTAPAEYITGQDFFTGQQFEDTDLSPAGFLTPIAPVLAAFGAAQQNSNGEWFITDKAWNLIRATNPLIDRTARLAPQAGGAPVDDRQLESILRTVTGAPIRTISDQQRANTLRGELFDQQRAQRRLQAIGG